MKQQRLIPREGIKLRHPTTGQPIPAEGVVVRGDLSIFWRARVKAGDVRVETVAVEQQE